MSLEGFIVATAIITAPMVLLGFTNDELAGTEKTGWFLLFFSLTWVWMFLSVPAADYATPGLNIRGAWHTVEAIFIVVFASMPFAFVHQRMTRSRKS